MTSGKENRVYSNKNTVIKKTEINLNNILFTKDFYLIYSLINELYKHYDIYFLNENSEYISGACSLIFKK